MSAVTITPECEEYLKWADTQFMVPTCEYFGINECEEYGLVDDEGLGRPGYYSRLKAPGFMDATDWDGPHHSREAALMSLFEMYGDEMPKQPTYAELGRIMLDQAGESNCNTAYGTIDPEWVGRNAVDYGDINRDGTLN